MNAYVNRGEIKPMDTLQAVPTTAVRGAKLAPGMVLLDPEFLTPAAEIDHRIRSVLNSGQSRYLAFIYEARTWQEISVGSNSDIKVMAR